MISIIITAWKEPETIKKAIQLILDEDIKNKLNENYEIIVVAPDKETINSAKSFQKKHHEIKVLKDPAKGKPIALNLVFKKAKGNILILTDGDVYISNGAIKELIAQFKKDNKVGEVTGHPIPTNERTTIMGFWSHLLTEAGAHRRRLELQKNNQFITGSGYLCAIKKGIINKIPENALSDDAVISNLIYNKGYKIKYAPNAIVNVKFPTTFSDWIKQKKRSAGGYNQLKELLKEKDQMRSFTKESSKILWALSYPKTIKEFFWTVLLIFARLYLWILIFIDINIKRKSFKEIWIRVESTK